MTTSISAAWLLKGHFDFFGQDPHNTTTLSVRANLCTALGLPESGLSIASYPVGPQFRHTYWWREGNTDYAEAQFLAAISKEHPVLSLGVSVEKGLEGGAAEHDDEVMDRRVWDWPRLVERLSEILSIEIPAVAASLHAPVHVRVSRRSHSEGETAGWHMRAFSFVQDQWFERHAGRVRSKPQAIVDHIRELDGLQDTWTIVHFAHDLGPADVDGMSPSEVAAILMRFNNLRRGIRLSAVASEATIA